MAQVVPRTVSDNSVDGRAIRKRTMSPGTWALVLGCVAAIVTLVKYGIGLHPEWARLSSVAAAWPNPDDAQLMHVGDQSLFSNIAAPWMLGLVGARSPQLFLIASLVAAVIAVALPFVMPTIRTNIARSKVMFLFVVGGPLPAVLFAWIGGYDTAVVITLVVAVLARNRWVSWAGWFALAFAHAAVGFFAWVFWVPMFLATSHRALDRAAVLRIVGAGVSGFAGWLVIRALTDLWGGSADRLSLFRAIHVSDLVSAYFASWPLMVFSVLGIGWFVLLSPPVRRTTPGLLLLAESVVAAVLVPLIAVDHTRIASMVLFGAVLAWVSSIDTDADGTLPATEALQVWRVLTIPALVVPVIVIWMGAPLVHAWPGLGVLFGTP